MPNTIILGNFVLTPQELEVDTICVSHMNVQPIWFSSVVFSLLYILRNRFLVSVDGHVGWSLVGGDSRIFIGKG